MIVSTRSRPKAAGGWMHRFIHCPEVSTRSRPKAAGLTTGKFSNAAVVSTRSRPKAAGSDEHEECEDRRRFNTQPPKGGWHSSLSVKDAVRGFNT